MLLVTFYLIIGLIWAIEMHGRLKWLPQLKWLLLFINVIAWPECMLIWVFIQTWKFIKNYYLNIPENTTVADITDKKEINNPITLDQLITKQKLANKHKTNKGDRKYG